MERKGGKGRGFDPLLTIWRNKVGLMGLEVRMRKVVGSISPLIKKLTINICR